MALRGQASRHAGIGAVVAQPGEIEVVVLAQHERADVFVPVRRVAHLLLRHGLHSALEEALGVVVFEGLAVIFLGRQFGGPQFAVFEAAANLVPIAWIPLARTGLDVVPVHVVHAVAIGPQLLAGHGAGLATQALVEVEHHRDLMLRHGYAFPFPVLRMACRSAAVGVYFTMSTLTSRLLPVGPQ